ncbi:MAG: hypothetical protein ACSHXY_00730 [Alphaproteobacteria bacterium]
MTVKIFKFPETTGRQILWVWAVAFAALIVKSLIMGSFGNIGTDSDDIMRLVQVRDLYAGQSWFDLTQTRMGPDGGTLMHWSRLADLPVLILIAFFDLFLPLATAEAAAITLWPPITAALVVWGVLVGAKHMASKAIEGRRGIIFAAVLLLFFLIPHYRFSPGSIDHHNLQLGLLAIVIGYAMDPDMRARSFAISGTSLALSVAIGVEVTIFVAIICGFFALNWLKAGAAAARGTTAFGLAFAGALALIFAATIAPQKYGVVSCDSYSVTTFVAGALGGLGLALLARFGSEKPLSHRVLGLTGLGVISLLLLVNIAPQCLSNPLDSLPVEARLLWLDHVIEAQPLFADRTKWFSLAPFILGPSCLALILAARQVHRNNRLTCHLVLGVLLLVSILMSVYQVRFHIFAGLFALFILPQWIGGIYDRTRAVSEKDVTYVFALAAAIPFVWGFPGLMLTPTDTETAANTEQAALCYSDDVIEAMKALPPGLFAATSNGTSPILSETKHRALSGNYHRNTKGILANIHILTSTPDDALELISKNKVEYIYVCRTTEETNVFKNYKPDGLIAALYARQVPYYMKPIGEDLEGGAVTLYRVTAP